MLAVIFLMGSVSVHAQLLVENFDYTIGAILTDNGWTAHSGSGTAAIDVTSGLTFTGYAGSGIGGAANVDNNGEDVNKTFETQNSGSLYVSFLLQTEATNSAGYFFMLSPSPVSSTFWSRIFVNSAGTGIGLSSTSTAPTTFVSITPLTPVLVVIKHDFTANTTDMFVLNSYSANEPTSSQSISETYTAIGAVAIRQYNASQRQIIDGIRVGTTWAEAVAPAASCDPSNLAFPSSTVDKVMGNDPFTIVATSDNATTAITYTSDATDVATVLETTGEVTLVGVGQVIITATQAAGTYNSTNYCASTATYTLNVTTNAPTITVTEVTIPTMVTMAGSSIDKEINVGGTNLTARIDISIFGTDAEVFSKQPDYIPETDGTAASIPVTVKYSPIAPGTHTATLRFTSGTTILDLPLIGTSTWKPLDTPVASDTSASNSSGFTANWVAVTDATEYQLAVYTKQGTAASDLFFSEYIEGSSNNKAIEIYNGTGTAIDLSQYSVELYANGATEVSNTLTLTGTLQHNDVYVIYNSSAVEALSSLGDVSSTVTYFNGDDAFVLKKGTVIIDSFGQLGTDPGSAWEVNGVSTVNQTLVRKSTVTSGRTDASSEFDPSVEWNKYDIDTFDYLRAHVMDGAITFQPITGSPFTVTGATSKVITGLDAGTTYYYTVTAKNTTKGLTSAVSNEIIGATLGTFLENPTSNLTVVAINGNIKFSALAGETVEVYNAIGQKLISKTTVDGINTISVAARGVILVKVGTKISKVIM